MAGTGILSVPPCLRQFASPSIFHPLKSVHEVYRSN